MSDQGTRPFEPFDLSVLGADHHLWLSASSRQGSVYGVPRPRPRPETADGFARPDEWLKEAISHANVEAYEQGARLGAALTDLIFDVPEVASLFQQTRGVAGARGAQLLVRLLAAPQELSSWPWELMVDPQQRDRFLTRSRDVHVVRAGRSRTYPVRADAVTPPINVLMVLSSPLRAGPNDNETPFDLYEEKRALLGELRPLVNRGLLRVEVEDRPSIERLRSRMAGQRRGFHVLHYLGHAQPAGLKLELPSGRGRLVPSEEFSLLLQQLPDLRLAVFAGCETARVLPSPEGTEMDWPGQLSTADHCVRDACPMVVGMQAVLPFGTERLFTRYFYQALTAGQTVAEALRLARLAIADDEQAGGRLLNWAVPCLFVGGSEPGPLLDPEARVTPPAPRRRVGLRLGVAQSDLRFISRLSELREAVDVLTGRSNARVLMITGAPGTGKTAFLDRVVEELSGDVAYLLTSVQRLMEEDDPLQFLCQTLAELISRTGQRPPPQGRDGSLRWWERLLEVLADTDLALALDDADLLVGDDPRAVALRDALAAQTRRRSRTRLALAAREETVAVTAPLRSGQLRTISLKALSWPEVWQWIRRNLPILTGLGESNLSPYYADLPRLEDWERMAEAMVAGGPTGVAQLDDLVRRVASSSPGPTSRPAPPPVFSSAPGASAAATTLRVAVAGPHTAGRTEEFARGITQFAAEHHVSGRVAGLESNDTASRLAELVPLTSPFDESGAAGDEVIAQWLVGAKDAGADVILLDFGGPSKALELDRLIAELAAANRLVIAAAGNRAGEKAYPAWSPGVLAVGALEGDAPAPYSTYFARDDKPDIYAPETVAGSALAVIVATPDLPGPSFAALRVLAAAIAVWATDRGLSAREVSQLLLDTATRHGPRKGRKPRQLNVTAALDQARRQLLLDALEWGPLGLHQLLAETGMRPELALPILDELVTSGDLQRAVSDGEERYENPNAVHLAYERLRRAPGTGQRTQELETLVDRVRVLAARGRYRVDEVALLWQSGQEGRRVSALGVIQAVPALGSTPIVLDAIRSPLTTFELHQALRAGAAYRNLLTPEQRDDVVAAIERHQQTGAMIDGDADLRQLANDVVRDLSGPG